MTTERNEAIRLVHVRMPVLLHPVDYGVSLNGSFDDAPAFQARCHSDHLIETRRTDPPWVQRRAPPVETTSLL